MEVKPDTITRESLTTNLEARYQASNLEAKKAGGAARTDFISSGDDDFKTFANRASSNIEKHYKGSSYANIDTTKYGGRKG